MHGAIKNERIQNNFGFLRVVFATLVVLSHSPELADGNRSREILSSIFGSLSFGEFAVDGFFIISGYLITKSFVNSKTWIEYLVKRTLRIYPGYIVAYIVSILFFGLLAGGNGSSLLHLEQIKAACMNLTKLGMPHLDGAFQGLHYPDLNASMWSIAYEFECYLLIILFGVLGILRRPRLYAAVTALAILLMLCHTTGMKTQYFDDFITKYQQEFRLMPIFLCGGCFYILQKHIAYTKRGLIVASIGLLALLCVRSLAEPALAVLGSYIFFWLALHYKSKRLGAIGSRNDLSYGIYLYAWPIQNFILYHYRDISPWSLFILALGTSTLFSYCSWKLVEHPFLRLKKYAEQFSNMFSIAYLARILYKIYSK